MVSASSAQKRAADLVAAARPAVFWTDRPGAPAAAATLRSHTLHVDLAIIGAGFSGLWAALQAIEDDPGRSIMVLEAQEAGFGASTRNGGFCEASLTHGLENGLHHWPSEIETLLAMGDRNLAQLLTTVDRLGIDAAVERTGQLHVAVEPWQVEDLHAEVQVSQAHGVAAELLDQHQTRAQLNSPTYLAGVWERDAAVMVDPAWLTWGLRRACERLGVQFRDRSRVLSVEPEPGGTGELRVRTASGSVRADRVIAVTNAWAEPVSRIRRWVIPVHDHVLMTEPLSTAQMDSIGWGNRQGVADAGHQFHYFRLTRDNRILWGGWDANYHRGNAMGSSVEHGTDTHALLAEHFVQMFPQLEDVRFSHRWAGPIGTTSAFAAGFGTEFGGRLAWAAGYTGLGVGASRWGARVALDLVDGIESERTELKMVRRKPIPFPPEPFRYPVVALTRRAIVKAGQQGGEEGLWLKFLGRLGVGFNS